jgi:hypothetical protein
MITIVCGKLTFDASLVASVMNTASVPAGFARLIGKFASSPGATVRFDGRTISLETVTLAVAPVTFAGPVARMVVLPGPAPLTVTFTVFELAGIVTEPGTVATAVLSELNATVTAFAVCAERFNAMVCVPLALTLMLCGEKLSEADTATVPVSGV